MGIRSGLGWVVGSLDRDVGSFTLWGDKVHSVSHLPTTRSDRLYIYIYIWVYNMGVCMWVYRYIHVCVYMCYNMWICMHMHIVCIC